MGKKTEGKSADSRCVDREVKGEGQRRDFLFTTCTGSETAVMRRPFGSVIMTKINFKVKRTFYSEIGGHVLTPDFNTCQG